MKVKYFLLICISICCMTSCQTALKGIEAIAPNNVLCNNQNQMEFIGFQNIHKSEMLCKDFGAELERQGLALNNQRTYVGDFSLDNLIHYPTSARYISYIEVSKQRYIKNDSYQDNYSRKFFGWYIAGWTLFTLFPVYIPLLCTADVNKCEITFDGEYYLHIFDKKLNEIVYSKPITVYEEKIYKGEYLHRKTDQNKVDNRYQRLLYNALLDGYADACEVLDSSYYMVSPTFNDTTFSLNPKVGWLSIVGDSTDLTDARMELLHKVESGRGKKMSNKEIKQNTSIHSLPLENVACDTGTYQLKIAKKKFFDYNRTISINEGDNIILSPKMRPHVMNTFIIAEAGVALNPEWGVGLMFGQMYDGVGWYVKGRSNWNIPKKDQYGGKLFNTIKETTSIEWIVDAGLVVDFLMKKEKKDKDNFLGLYVGAGYGSRERYWLNKFKYGVIYPANSYKGVSANIGMIGSWHGMTFMAGVNTLAFKYMEVEAGIGYTF